jgi:hypothetical protein
VKIFTLKKMDKIEVNVPKSQFHISKSKLHEEYIDECFKIGFTKFNRKNIPLHLHSFYVYLAYNHAWKFINRNKITQEQIDIIKYLGCYKLTRTELGTRYSPPLKINK